jgi:hypothetical protein
MSLGAPALGAGLVHASVDTQRAALAALQSLEVHATLHETSGSYTETRTYARGDASATFYRSLVGAADTTVTEALIDGARVEGAVLPVVQADAVRRQLAQDLYDPAPLRECGTPLFVLEIPAGSSPVEIRLTTTGPLSSHGTLRGLSAPVDWDERPAGFVSIDVQAETELPARVLYAPYHDLSVVRDGDRVMRGSFQRRSVYTELDVTLLLSTGADPLQVDLVPFRYSAAEGGYYLAKLAADSAETGRADPRDIAFAFDVSGSMGGSKIDQAQAMACSVSVKRVTLTTGPKTSRLTISSSCRAPAITVGS